MNSIYIHVPFCHAICSYCDFTKFIYNPKFVRGYLNELKKEISQYSFDQKTYTIYIGGGTPSALEIDELKELLEIVQPFLPCKEFTIECNPESLTLDKLRLMYQMGVDRLSIGVQTFQDELLKAINRQHSSKDAYRCIKEAREVGFKNISIDMMYNLPHQSLELLEKDLAIVKELPITHLSYYSLILEEKTILSIQKYQLEDDYEFSEMIKHYPLPFKRYEISNYALEGYESKHNKVYWHNEHYYGFGPGAHGYLGNIRYHNTNYVAKYIKGENKVEKEEIDLEDMMFEEIMLGLRLVEGIDLAHFYQKYSKNLLEVFHDVIQKNIKQGLLVIENGSLRTTELGFDLLDNILLDFLK